LPDDPTPDDPAPADPIWPGPPPSLVTAALRGRCPRCGQGGLFLGLLTIRDACAVCGLDLRGNDAGDGAPVAVMFVLGPILVILAFWMEFRFDPPLWVFVVVLGVVTLPGAILLMRITKGALVALQFRYRRSELGN
jgi:uncharacterized protein (DUF983 family)